jgi:purine-binding chemotaxis protein CheW
MSTRHVSFVLAGGSYCLPVDRVVQILRNENVLHVPKAPPFVVGVVNLRGDVIPVLDLRMRLGLPAEDSGRRRRILVAQLGKRSYGLLVDEVREIVELEEGAVSEDSATLFGARSPYVSAVARKGEALYLLLDLAAALAPQQASPAGGAAGAEDAEASGAEAAGDAAGEVLSEAPAGEG